MGADITHGPCLQRKVERIAGDLIVEIIPVGGGYYGASYSSVRAALDYAQAEGIPPDVWPIYYGISDSGIDIDEVYQRCDRLKRHLSTLPRDVLAGDQLLKLVAGWLDAGERFLITE